MSFNQMDSIWIDDEEKGVNKLYLNDPTIQVVNSTTPMLLGKNTIELPPLPPSSFFQATLQAQKEELKLQKQNGIVKLFKKLSFNTKDKSEQAVTPRRKISTPFDFNHISHINQETPITNKSFQMPASNSSLDLKVKAQNEFTVPQSPILNNNNGICFNTTSPQINNELNYSPKRKNLRGTTTTMSNSTSINSNLFQRTASISTLATSISGRSRKHSSFLNNVCINENDRKDYPYNENIGPVLKKQSVQTTHNLNLKQHHHQNSTSSSTSSIENLKKLEKNQISKQCSMDYTSNFKYPKNFESWETPDPQNVVRQSWIYEDLSPFVPKFNVAHSPLKEQATLKRSNSISYSPSYHYNSPLLKQELNLFQNEMEISFKSDQEYKKIMDSIDQFKQIYNEASTIKDSPTNSSLRSSPISNLRSSRFTFQNELSNLGLENAEDEDEEETFNETIASLRAAKYIRMSRMDSIHNNNVKLNGFNIITPDQTNEEHDIEVSKPEENDEELINDEDPLYSEPESTPTQHKIGVLLPSILD